jgi:hypothetical protein
MQQTAAKTRKARYKAKAKNGQFLLNEMRGPAIARNERQSAANAAFSVC